MPVTVSGPLSVCWARGLDTPAPALCCSFASGCVALPVLMNIKAVIEQRQCTGVWSHKDELPVSPGGGGVGRKRGGQPQQEVGLTPRLPSPD